MHRALRVRPCEGLDRLGDTSNEIESRHRVDLDATITAMAQTAKDMNSKYKETSQAGLALSVTLC
jgi:L-serine dehydratase